MAHLMKLVLLETSRNENSDLVELIFKKAEIIVDHLQKRGLRAGLFERMVDSTSFRFQLWQIATGPRFKAVRSPYYLGCLGGIMLWNVAKPDMLMDVKDWVNEIWMNNGKGIIPIAIVGNKTGLHDVEANAPVRNAGLHDFIARLNEKTRLNRFEVFYQEIGIEMDFDDRGLFDYFGRIYLQWFEESKNK